MNEISLALSGGAARGAYQLGVLQFLDEQNIQVKAISAASIGSIIGASYASGVSPKEQLKIYKSKEFRKTFSINFFGGSFLKVNYKARIFEDLMPIKNIEDLRIPTYINAVDMQSGENICFNSGDTELICLGSSALVPMFPPIAYEGYKLIDGGTINHMPIEELKKYPYKIVGVNLHPIYSEEINNNIYSNFKRAVFLGAYRNSLHVKNECDIYITSPKLKEYSLFSFKYLDEMFQLGYGDAAQALESF